jgi:hypothetical protein
MQGEPTCKPKRPPRIEPGGARCRLGRLHQGVLQRGVRAPSAPSSEPSSATSRQQCRPTITAATPARLATDRTPRCARRCTRGVFRPRNGCQGGAATSSPEHRNHLAAKAAARPSREQPGRALGRALRHWCLRILHPLARSLLQIQRMLDPGRTPSATPGECDWDPTSSGR